MSATPLSAWLCVVVLRGLLSVGGWSAGRS